MEEMNEDWDNCCPLCMEEMDSTDRQLKPCRCGYQICVWCWNHIMEMAEKDSTEGRCPACRTPYDKEKIVSTAVRLGENSDKKQKPGKAKTKSAEGRKNLSNVRVIQRNLVYVVGIPAALADEEILERKEYFGQYGKILKISVSKTGGNSSQHSSPMSSVSVYVTYVKEEDAMRCIQSVNGYVLDGKMLKACFGTTKYCNAWLKQMPCNNPDCLYLHDEGTREDSFTKEEMLAKYGSKNQHFHDLTHPPQRRLAVGLPPPMDTPLSSTSSIPQSTLQTAPTLVGNTPKAVPLVVNLPKSSSLPAAASWGSRPSPSRPGLGKNIGLPATKAKAGAGLINLATVSGSLASGQAVSNPDGIKHAKTSNTDGAHIPISGASRILERTLPAAEPSLMTRAVISSLDTDDATSDVRHLSNVEFPQGRSSNSAENDDHAFEAIKEMELIDNALSEKFAGAEESGFTIEAFATKGLSRTAPIQDVCSKNSMGLLTPLSFEGACISGEDNGSETRCGFHLPPADCNSNLGLCTDLEALSQKLENSSKQESIKSAEGPSVPEENSGCQNTNGAAVSLPSNIGDMSILLRPDHNSCEDHEDISCKIGSGDVRSNSTCFMNSNERAIYTQSEAAEKSEKGVLSQKTGDNFQSVRKAPINGLSEHELVSDMLSRGFDLWTDGSAHDLTQLLFDGTNLAFPSTSALQESATSWKSPVRSKQSRFQFARQDEVHGQIVGSNRPSMQSGYDGHPWQERNNKTSGNVPVGFTEVSAGTSSHVMNSKSSMMAPPGFSAVRASTIPPPGFSQPKTTDMRRLAEASQDPSRLLVPTSGFMHVEAANIPTDVEFIDPAIMAVGKGKLPVGSQTPVPFGNSPLSAFLSQIGSLPQQSKPLVDFEPSYQGHQDGSYSTYGYSNQDIDATSSSLFHSSFNDTINQSRLVGQYHDGNFPHVIMQESVYSNGGHRAPKLRFQHSSSDDWNRLSEVATAGQQSVNDAVGLAMSQLSLHSRLEELSLSKDLSSKYYGDSGIPTGYDEQGPISSARIGRSF